MILFCFSISLGVAYQHSIVAKAVIILHPREDFEISAVPGIIAGCVSFGSIFLQHVFRLFIYFNVTNNSNNLLSLKSVVLIFLSFFILLLSINQGPHLFIVVLNIDYILKYFVLPLMIIYSNDEARHYFKIHNEKVMNFVPTVIQYFQLLQIKIFQFILQLKSITLGPSNQIAPIDEIELQDVIH